MTVLLILPTVLLLATTVEAARLTRGVARQVSTARKGPEPRW